MIKYFCFFRDFFLVYHFFYNNGKYTTKNSIQNKKQDKTIHILFSSWLFEGILGSHPNIPIFPMSLCVSFDIVAGNGTNYTVVMYASPPTSSSSHTFQSVVTGLWDPQSVTTCWQLKRTRKDRRSDTICHKGRRILLVRKWRLCEFVIVSAPSCHLVYDVFCWVDGIGSVALVDLHTCNTCKSIVIVSVNWRRPASYTIYFLTNVCPMSFFNL